MVKYGNMIGFYRRYSRVCGGIPLFLEQIAREYTGTCMIPCDDTGAGSPPLKIRYHVTDGLYIGR